MIARGKTKAAEIGRGAAPTPAPTISPTPQLDAMVKADPDLVERIFDYAVKLMPQIAEHRAVIVQALRDEFAGERVYIRRKDADLAGQVLDAFNGRNATEIARELRIGRATVYRKLKQPARKAR